MVTPAAKRRVAKFRNNATGLDHSPVNSLSVAYMSRTKKRLIGYARVSTAGQDLSRQVRALKAERCSAIFADTASGKSLEGRPELGKAIDELAPGDTLLLAEWDRATRSMWDGLQIVKQVLDAGATIRVLDFPSLDLTTPEGRGFLALFSAMAERERIRIVKRTQEGRRLAIEAGKRMGRKPKLTAHQSRSARVRLANGESTRDVAKDFAVHHATIARLR
jgi:DNA invertase Pin-like site-specific DNA recombinase